MKSIYKLHKHYITININNEQNKIGFILITIIFIAGSIINYKLCKLTVKRYREYKEEFKKQIFNEFLQQLNHLIKWDKIDKSFLMELEYKKANFNRITPRINKIRGMYFEDYIEGTYNDKFSIEICDFKKVIELKKSSDITQMEGIFCKVKIKKDINNNIRITNNKIDGFLYEKEYIVTTMPRKFYKNFKIIAQNGSEISTKINMKAIEIMQEFYNNSKIKFDISIINDEIYFRFRTIDTMEPRKWRNTLDELMIKEYITIIMFVIQFCEKFSEDV